MNIGGRATLYHIWWQRWDLIVGKSTRLYYGISQGETAGLIILIRWMTTPSGRSYKGSDMAGLESALKALANDRRRREEDSG